MGEAREDLAEAVADTCLGSRPNPDSLLARHRARGREGHDLRETGLGAYK
jgi:hypothetical protein